MVLLLHFFHHQYLHESAINSLRPRPNRCHVADDIFKCIFKNENERISPRVSLKFVPKVRISNIPALVQIMAWRRPGDKPLSEPVMVSLLTHICVTRPQWVKNDIIKYTPNAMLKLVQATLDIKLNLQLKLPTSPGVPSQTWRGH